MCSCAPQPQVSLVSIPSSASAVGTVYLVCTGAGGAAGSYSWRRNSSVLSPPSPSAAPGSGAALSFNADASVLTIANVAAADAGNYTCTFTPAAAGTPTSNCSLALYVYCMLPSSNLHWPLDSQYIRVCTMIMIRVYSTDDTYFLKSFSDHLSMRFLLLKTLSDTPQVSTSSANVSAAIWQPTVLQVYNVGTILL